MARTVADAAALLTAMAGTDARDAATRGAELRKAADLQPKHLDPNALKARVGRGAKPVRPARNDLVAAEVEKRSTS